MALPLPLLNATHPLLPGPACSPLHDIECEAFDRLERACAKPSFLRLLKSAAHSSSKQGRLNGDGHTEDTVDAFEPSQPEDCAAGFVVLDGQDAVEAMAFYIAQCIAQHPGAQQLTPQQLQEALTAGFKSLRQSRLQRILSMGRRVYRITAVGASAIQVYNHPYIVKAILLAVYKLAKWAC